jgi:hypothetical protein
VKHADARLLATEFRDVMIEMQLRERELPPPLFERIVPCTDWVECRELFVDRFRELTS